MLPDLLLPMRYPAKRIRAILVLAALILSVAPAAAQVTSQDASQVTSEVTSQVTSQVTWRMTTEYPENNISGIGLRLSPAASPTVPTVS